MEKFIQLGKKFGLEGEKLLDFVREQEEKEDKRRDEEREEKRREEECEEKRRQLQEEEEREERRRRQGEEREARCQEREIRKLQQEADLMRQKEAAEVAKREHELELARIAAMNGDGRTAERGDREDRAKAPKLPSFVDGKDNLDAYLQRFERFAKTAKWKKDGWASKLSALLSGRALEVYSHLSEDAAKDYDSVKIALMKRYDLTEDGYRRKFRVSKPEVDESPEQFIVRLDRYLLRWLELSNTARTFDGLKDLIVKEQFIDSCPKDLAIHLRQRAPETLAMIAKIADQYLEAHGKHLFSSVSRKPTVQPERDEVKNMQINPPALHCFKCNTRGHKAVNCPTLTKKCFLCGKQGHEARNCRSGGRRPGGQSKDGNPVQRGQVSASRLVQPPEVKPTDEEVKACIKDDKLLLACGKKIPLLSSACVEPLTGVRSKMPVVKGRVGEMPVDVLRDTGCSGIVVKRDLVSEDQFTGEFNVMLLIDNTARNVPIAKIDVDTSYLKGQVEAQCLPDAIYDLIIGNVPGARAADKPDPSWQVPVQEACAVTTRSQAKKAGEHIPLKVPDTKESPVVDREKLKQIERDDESLQKFWEKDDVVVRGQAETSFEVKGGVLYHVYKHPYVNRGKPLKQVMVPVQLRSRIMELVHGSIMGGHMGIKKTTDKIQSVFYWPGIQGDVTRYCKSCDVCQKTVNKGSVPKVPLEKMPLIDKPFKRVAIDLVGPIVPPSEDGHRYILTLVDFATRYPEAVPLKNIDTVAEVLVDIFSRLGVPEEILSDLGTQFVSECMKEVTRLLSIKQLTTTPYHPMCNGLTEKFNGTMKSMLKRLCNEQPRQWHRYINPLLFAYREVPQESTGFSPFELLYGRAVRGPMFILKELWTKELEEPEVKNSYQYVFELREKLEDTLKLVHTELQKAQNKGKHYYDRKTKVRKFVPGDKVLVLLPTNHNKLLMQWKGPFEVSAVVGLNDYRVRVKGKERVYHANLLKKYFEREDPVSVGAVAVGTNANISKNEQVESEVEEVDPVDSIDFLEIGGYVAKESVNDVTIGDNLSHEQRAEFMDLPNEFQSLFTEAPGTTSLAQHHIKLTSDQPVR